jgi:hypothetical protein
MRSLIRALAIRPVVEGLWAAEGLPFAATLAAFVAGFVLSPREAAMGFYDATSQIIPVLLLVLAVELRFLHLSGLPSAAFLLAVRPEDTEKGPTERATAAARRVEHFFGEGGSVTLMRAVVGIGTILALAVGEFIALHPLSTDDAAAGNPRWIYGALCAGTAAIAVLSFQRGRRRGPPDGS